MKQESEKKQVLLRQNLIFDKLVAATTHLDADIHLNILSANALPLHKMSKLDKDVILLGQKDKSLNLEETLNKLKLRGIFFKFDLKNTRFGKLFSHILPSYIGEILLDELRPQINKEKTSYLYCSNYDDYTLQLETKLLKLQALGIKPTINCYFNKSTNCLTARHVFEGLKNTLSAQNFANFLYLARLLHNAKSDVERQFFQTMLNVNYNFHLLSKNHPKFFTKLNRYLSKTAPKELYYQLEDKFFGIYRASIPHKSEFYLAFKVINYVVFNAPIKEADIEDFTRVLGSQKRAMHYIDNTSKSIIEALSVGYDYPKYSFDRRYEKVSTIINKQIPPIPDFIKNAKVEAQSNLNFGIKSNIVGLLLTISCGLVPKVPIIFLVGSLGIELTMGYHLYSTITNDGYIEHNNLETKPKEQISTPNMLTYNPVQQL